MITSARWFATLCFAVSAVAAAAPRMPMVDGDADGVNDERDECPYTEPGIQVNKQGCPLLANDGDADGVADALDACPYSPAGGKVDAKGCAIDTDFDGVANGLDACPNSQIGQRVGDNGCAEGEVAELKIATPEVAAALPMEVVKPASETPTVKPAKPAKKEKAKPKAKPPVEAPIVAEPATPAAPVQAAPETPVMAAAEVPEKPAKPARKPKVKPPVEAPVIAAPAPEVVKPALPEPPAVVAESKPAEPKPAKAAAPAVDQTEVRPPADSDKIKAEKPSKAYLAARAAAERAPEPAAVAPAKPEPKAEPKPEPKPEPVAVVPPAPANPEPLPSAMPEPQPVPAVTKPAPEAAGGSNIAALLDSLKEEGDAAVPAGKTPDEAARAAGEKPEKAGLTIHFAAASTEIANSAQTQLRALGNAMKLLTDGNPALTVKLSGFAGKGESQTVVERRMALVRAVLMGRGIGSDRIQQSTGKGGSGRVEVSSSQ